jgi:hypothetical protein
MPKGNWIRSNQPGKPTDTEKRVVEEAFAPVIANMKAELPPLQEPQQFNQCVDFKASWRGSYYTLNAVYQSAPNSAIQSFEVGVARLTFLGKDHYALAYFQHTEKWHVIFPSISLEDAIEAVKSDPWFEV